MYYRPTLANGKLVENPWTLRVYRALNAICWPLEDNASFAARVFDRVYWIFGTILFLFHNEAEVRYLRENFENIDELLTGMPTYLILVEIHLRGFQLGLMKENLKKLQKKFYTTIYIEKLENPEHFQRIHVKLRLVAVVSSMYFSTLGLYLIAPVMNFLNNRRQTLYKMTFAFDFTPYYFFYPIILCNLWVGFIVVSMIMGELNVVAQMILHLNGRLMLLREDLEKCSQRLLKQADPSCIARKFQVDVQNVIQRNVELYKFANEFHAEFSYRIFIWFAFSAGMLCVLGFKVYTNPAEGFAFLVWGTGKVLELCSIGELGSTLVETSDEVSSMYYHSNWELIVERSTNKRENVRLMKLVLLAMETSHKPIYLTGLNFFHVTLTAVVTILQGAGSYFTCLVSMR